MKLSTLFLIMVISMTILSQNQALNINLIQKLAVQAYSGNKVLADLTTAQAILESGLTDPKYKLKGGSDLATKYNNLFGIKGKGTKGSVSLPTHEFIRGKMITVNQSFAWNESVEDSIEQKKRLFQNGTKDKPNRYFKVLAAQTFEEAAKAVYEAGYATDPHYVKQLIDIYNQYLKD